MPTTINQIQVLDQTESKNDLIRKVGEDVCGIHTFKNVILSLSKLDKKQPITEQEFRKRVVDEQLFEGLFQTIFPEIEARENQRAQKRQNLILQPGMRAMSEYNKEYDIAQPEFENFLVSAQMGLLQQVFDPIKKNVSTLDYNQVTLISYNPGNQFSLGGIESTLSFGNAINTLAKNKEGSHVFAIALNTVPAHWITASLSIDKFGNRHWEYMDSYKNQQNRGPEVIEAIEVIIKNLINNPAQLRAYLVSIYNEANKEFERINKNYLKAGNKEGARQFLCADYERFIFNFNQIKNQTLFIRSINDFGKDKNELEKIDLLLSVARLMINDSSIKRKEVIEAKKILNELCTELEKLKKSHQIEDKEEKSVSNFIHKIKRHQETLKPYAPKKEILVALDNLLLAADTMNSGEHLDLSFLNSPIYQKEVMLRNLAAELKALGEGMEQKMKFNRF